MKKPDKTKILTVTVVVTLCAIFAIGFVWGLDSVLSMEGSFPPANNVPGIAEVPQTGAQAVKLLDDAVKLALQEKPKLENENRLSIDEDSIETDAGQTVRDSLLYCREGFTDRLRESLPTVKADYSEGFAGLLNLPAFSQEDVKSFACSYLYYQCPSCGEESEEPQASCEKCGSVYAYVEKYRDEYLVTLDLAVREPLLAGNFKRRSPEELRAMYRDGFSPVLTVDSTAVSYETLRVIYRVERLTAHLTSLTYETVMPVNAKVTFTEDYAALGKHTVSFTATRTETYTFLWPKLSLSAHTLSLEPKGTDNLLATLVCPDPAKTAVSWQSSDENVVSVDEDGYLKGGKEPGSATVTASFRFAGKTYTDSCEIQVKISVESLAISERKITLREGGSKLLSVKPSPKNATVQTVHWYTEDAEVATVEENGQVTARSKGVTKVYALSDDGYYKSSCEVTVE